MSTEQLSYYLKRIATEMNCPAEVEAILARWRESQKQIERLNSPTILDMGIEDSAMRVTLTHPFAIQAMAESFYDTVKDAENYVECHFKTKDGKEIIVTVQKADGKSPHELRVEAEKRLATMSAKEGNPTAPTA